MDQAESDRAGRAKVVQIEMVQFATGRIEAVRIETGRVEAVQTGPMPGERRELHSLRSAQ